MLASINKQSVEMDECGIRGMFNVCLKPFKTSIMFFIVIRQLDLIALLSVYYSTAITFQKQTVDQSGSSFQKTFFGIATLRNSRIFILNLDFGF